MQDLQNESPHNVGGGVALIFNSDLNPEIIKMVRFPSIVFIALELKLPQPPIVSIIYLPPDLNIVTFLEDLLTISQVLYLYQPRCIIADLYIHFNKSSELSFNFTDILELFQIWQFIHLPNYRYGNTLDLISSTISVKHIIIFDP